MLKEIEKPKIAIINYTYKDHRRTYGWLQDAALRRLIGTTSPPTTYTHKAWLKRMKRRRDVKLFAIYYNNVHIGNLHLVNINRVDRSAEIGFYIGRKEFRNKGLGTCVLGMIKKDAFIKMGLHRLYCFIFYYNKNSQNCFRKEGFKLEGRLKAHRKVGNKFCDVLIFGCLKKYD